MPITLDPVKQENKVKETDSDVKPKHYNNYRVLLRNDDSVCAGLVIESLMKHVSINEQRATSIMLEAHQTGTGEVIVCAQEIAEHYEDLLKSDGLDVYIQEMSV
jgi:ATP-dependent Clp protease adapter protein ClpS